MAGHVTDTREARALAAIQAWAGSVHDALPATCGRAYIQGLLLQLQSLAEDTP